MFGFFKKSSKKATLDEFKELIQNFKLLISVDKKNKEKSVLESKYTRNL
jgi:hypothetical protein